MTTFADLGLPAPIVRILADQGITSPFPIQTATLPDTLRGADVLGRGRTGSGKTLAFGLPLVVRLAADRTPRRPRRPRGLVLCPTRELAHQIDAVLVPIARALGLSTTTIHGGVAQSRQVAELNRGVDILVACPGRLEDLLHQNLLTLDGVSVTVLDEADHMADLGFLPAVRRILDRTPSGGQRMLFSATLDNGVDLLVRRYLSSPVHHEVDSVDSPIATMTHHVLEVADADTKQAVVRQLAGGTGRRLLFTRTKHQAKKLARQLTAQGVPAVDLQGNLAQGARERHLAAFSAGDVRVLVATDIAARGLHVDDIELVVHVDPPAEHKAYLHRSGRTARAGAGGDVVTIVLPEQRADVRALTRAAHIVVRPQSVRPGDPTVTALVGPVAPLVAPVAVGPAATTVAPSGRARMAGASGRRGAGAPARTTARAVGAAGAATQDARDTPRGHRGGRSRRPAGASSGRSTAA